MPSLTVYHITSTSPRKDGKAGFAIIPFQANYASEDELQRALDQGGAVGFHLIYDRVDAHTRKVREKYERTLKPHECQLVRVASNVEYVFG
jgi:hypothetical protein